MTMDAVVDWLNNTAGRDDLIYTFAAVFASGGTIGLDEHGYVIAIEPIGRNEVVFCVPVTKFHTDLERLEFVNARAAPRRKANLALRQKRDENFHPTSDGTGRYVRTHSLTWLDSLWRPTPEALSDHADNDATPM